MRVSALALAVLAASPAAAQVPFRYLVVSEAGGAKRPSVRYLEPGTGVATAVETPPRNILLRSAGAVAVDPGNARHLYVRSGLIFIGGVTFARLVLNGNKVSSFRIVRGRLPGRLQRALPARVLVRGKRIYFTVRTGSNAGFHSMPLAGGSVTTITKIAGAFDVVVKGAKAYFNTFTANRPSTIVEVDLASNKTRTLGTRYPTFRSLGLFGGGLLAGSHSGDLYTVNVTTGASVRLAPHGRGSILAIASGPAPSTFFFATGRKQVWAFPNLSKPLYTAPAAIRDLDAGVHDLASLLAFGRTCKGGNGKEARFVLAGVPSLGNAGFTMQMRSARASAPATLVLGLSRQTFQGRPLPLALDSIGMTGCKLFTDFAIALGLTTGAGGAGSVRVPIPNLGWKGAHFMGQFFVVDAAANPLGLAASDGAEAIVR